MLTMLFIVLKRRCLEPMQINLHIWPPSPVFFCLEWKRTGNWKEDEYGSRPMRCLKSRDHTRRRQRCPKKRAIEKCFLLRGGGRGSRRHEDMHQTCLKGKPPNSMLPAHSSLSFSVGGGGGRCVLKRQAEWAVGRS